MKNKIFNFFNNGVYVLLTSLLCAIMFLNLFFHHVRYAARREFLSSNLSLLAASLCLYLAFAIFLQAKGRPTNFKSVNKYSVFLFFIMLYVAFNIYFLSNWDVRIVSTHARAVARRQEIHSAYFSLYPNNQMLLLLESLLFYLDDALMAEGGFELESHFILIVFQVFLYALAGNALYKILLAHESTAKYAKLGWLNFCILLAFTGWITVPYTDGMGIIFPILILRMYQKKENAQSNKLKDFYWILISLLAYWGFKMKPQAVIIFIAILIEEFLFGIKNFSKNILIKSARAGVLIILCFAISDIAFQKAFKWTTIEINKELDVGVFHMLMMGLKNDGTYDHEDVGLSWSIRNKKARTRAQLNVIKQRLKDYGIKGLLRHTARKSLVVFNDGTFAWGMEGGFYLRVYKEKNNFVSGKLRSIFYNFGRHHMKLATIEQAVWLMTLFACGFCFLIKKDKFNSVTVIALIGIIIFEYLFEARARYLIIYVPVFIVMSMICLEAISKKICR